ncbi:MAG: 50S ribosomal protein L35 [Gammaproteobacteria bacterium]
MNKLKTHRGAAKRFRRTATGEYKRRRANRNHILTKRSREQKRRLRVSDLMVNSADRKAVKRMLAGG